VDGFEIPVSKAAAIVLAAGRSRRMGAFKPLLPFGEKSVISTCLDNFRAAGVDDIVVVIGHRADEIRNHLRDLTVSFALNPDPESEMSVSIRCGVEALSGDAGALLITPTDHPGVSSDVIRLLIDQWTKGARLIIPEYHGRGGHPVLVDSAFRGELLALDPQRGLRSLFEAHRSDVCRLAVECPFVARDMDTWDDYLGLHQEIFGNSPVFRGSVDDAQNRRSLKEPN
jgi:molybdenum cofactor cytidylyltransferase